MCITAVCADYCSAAKSHASTSRGNKSAAKHQSKRPNAAERRAAQLEVYRSHAHESDEDGDSDASRFVLSWHSFDDEECET